ncbi:MAG TPA: chemotaxis protein CheV [Gammaproteobacteria bacterium]|nr:chemotaxis protein CheV [Gammaproteobacteria bacterium]
MAGVMEGVNQRTRLVGHNRLELLLFRLGSKQRFGINVFKIQEVMQCPPLTHIPKSHHVVRGVAHMRGKTIPVMDLGQAIGRPPIADIAGCFVIITEYNSSIQGFLVSAVDRIINVNWESILPPPTGSGSSSYLTAVTNVDNELVEIIDVEKVLAEVTNASMDVSESIRNSGEAAVMAAQHILVVDDSSVARNQVTRTLDQIGVSSTVARDGREGLNILQKWAAEGQPVSDRLTMVITDIEMPEMDGYTLTAEIKKDPLLKDLYVLMHTSLSGVFNNAMVRKVGADQFVPKFRPDQLAQAVLDRVKERTGMQPKAA